MEIDLKEKRIGIIGLGVLGGSYAQALHSAGYRHVIGVDINADSIQYALERGWIEEGSDDPSSLSSCEIVVSCLYPAVFVKWIKDHQHVFKTGTLLTDVTGVKRAVMEKINAILRKDVEFLACHPMAGREFRGIQYADAGRFQAANFILVPTEYNSGEAVDAMRTMAADMKFKTISCLNAREHDRMISYLSQLTHVIAVSLMNANNNTELSRYTGDSFRDLTRIAKINEEMWPELFILNKDYLIWDIDHFIQELEVFKEMVRTEDVEGMKEKMISSTKRRAAFDKENS